MYNRKLGSSTSAGFILAATIWLFSCNVGESQHNRADTLSSVAAVTGKNNPQQDSAIAHQYDFEGLKTDFSKHSIPLDSIFSGGPEKNGIPAIDFPDFQTIDQCKGFLSDPDYGILLQGKNEIKFYPINILNWHEIVNDEIDGTPVAVTFCPLCGSGIVYERLIGSDTVSFGVSGKLFESNLLMFDDKTESLWSQGMGEAVAGAYTGTKLKLVNSTITSFEDLAAYFPKAKVLSPKTGFDRNYSQYPYTDYLSSEDLYFPVSHKSNKFSPKDMMYVVQSGKSSIAFDWLALLKKGDASVKTADGLVSVKVTDNIPSATNDSGESLAGYFSFWFSWYTFYGERGYVWTSGKK